MTRSTNPKAARRSPPGAALAGLLLLAGCAGTGPKRSLRETLEDRGLHAGAPVILVDIDDTIYHRDDERPMPGAAAVLRELSEDHVIVYLTARPTFAKIPGVTQNRGDSLDFLEEHGFPDGPLFTSSLNNFLFRGQEGGKEKSFAQLREYGIETIALAVGDRPHDLRVYAENESVHVERVVIVLMEGNEQEDGDRDELPAEILRDEVPGSGPAWPRIHTAYENGRLDHAPAFVISQPPDAR